MEAVLLAGKFSVSSGQIPVVSGDKWPEVAGINRRSTASVIHQFPELSCRK